MARSNIIPQMFDIRPVNETGDLDWEKIGRVEKMIGVEPGEPEGYKNETVMRSMDSMQEINPEERKEIFRVVNRNHAPRTAKLLTLGNKFESEEVPFFYKSSFIPRIKPEIRTEKVYRDREEYPEEKTENYYHETLLNETFDKESARKSSQKKNFRRSAWNFSFSDLFFPARFSFNFRPQRSALYFASLSFMVAILVGGFAFGAKGLRIKGKVLGQSQEGYASLNSAIDSIKNQDFENSGLAFEKSYEKFSESSKDLDEMGKLFIELSKFFPFSSKLSSGKNMVEAGKHIAIAGQSMNKIIASASSIKNPLGEKNDQNISFLEIFQTTKKEIVTINKELEKVQENIDNVSVDDLPTDKRDQFMSLKSKLPAITKITGDFLNNSEIFTDLLGGNGPRKYLFLFQNNQEMRATGGFIGSYGLLDISEGRIRNFFIDGIFNPDGQLQGKIIPPKPIQKISAAWSLHDSNWFPNFPTSAKEAISFYEKTGGPTADGVITLTPTVMQKLLTITGPIEMPDYGITIDSDNFIEKTQTEVEVNYDKEENKPKKILSDLAPIILDKIFNARDAKSIAGTITILSEGLSEKQILLYSENKDLQKIISQRGWSGEILDSQKDYLSVINSNINGYKTDGVIDEKITHEAEIRNDGSVVDTVTITRHHNGGNSDYEWWNKVNSDYMRVYVPLGSKLLEADGQTREDNKPPLDYAALGFKNDPSVQEEEGNVLIDEKSGTKIYEDSGKTVFANWTYVSPQETLVIKYKYLLPFKMTMDEGNKPADSYSLFAQKQSGSLGSDFSSSLKFPKNYNVAWNYPENLNKKNGESELETKLDTDKFIGLVFTKEGILND